MFMHKSALLALGVVGASMGGAAHAQQVASNDTSSGSVELVVVTGDRGAKTTAVDSPVPISVISGAQLTTTGKAGLKQILSSVIPSLTLPAQNGGGTSASVPPYAVEGLTGDYVLVLINGKRRHNTASINNLATIGGGSTPVDFDFIPPASIDHIEYLRDGAAAQYGSDAIAGVINIILKGDTGGTGTADTTLGQTYKHAGALFKEDADWSTPLLGGFINFALSAVHNEPARATDPASGVLYPLINGQLDPREATASRDYGGVLYGRSTLNNQLNLSYNLSIPIDADTEFYSFSTIGYRWIKDGRGNFRPDDLSSLPQIFPNGFQAYRRINELDFQVATGARGILAGWNWDLSTTYGQDFFALGAENTLNASLGPTVDQTTFFMGKQISDQWTTNLDFTRALDIGLAKALDVSFGVEYRWEQFAEVAGEPNSYINGGYKIPNDGTPFGNLYHGKFPQAGLQSFTGTTPADASTHSRSVYAAYVDLGTNITPDWYVGLAGRFEHYDDTSGDSRSGKFTTRYQIFPGLAIRGSISNGFHAPSLAEEWFSTTQNTSVVVGGVVTSAQSKFLPVGNPIAQALGSTPLTPELSLNESVGFVLQPLDNLSITTDFYQIDIWNRIVKSAPNFSLTPAQVAALGFPGLTAAQFFTNGVDTRTQGVDVTVDYIQDLAAWGQIDWNAAFSANGTDIRKVLASAANFTPLAARQLVEQTPRYRLSVAPNWNIDKWQFALTETLYGRYEEPINNTIDEKFGPRLITDLDVTYNFTDALSLSVGANNIFNVYPQRVPLSQQLLANVDTTLVNAPGYSVAGYGIPLTGGGIYGNDSPYGLLGGFYYVRAGVRF
jgi:iron complex outermembrane receptor protein